VTALPTRLLKAPRLFYALAVVYAVFNVAEPIMQLDSVGFSASLPAGNEDLMRFAYIRLVANAIYQSLFLIGFGVIAELLVAIWHRSEAAEGVAEGAE